MSHNSTVRFIVFGTGTEVDAHMPMVEGQALRLVSGGGGEGGSAPMANEAGVGVMPGTAAVVDVLATSVGSWEMYCATLDHASSGMTARVVVTAS